MIKCPDCGSEDVRVPLAEQLDDSALANARLRADNADLRAALESAADVNRLLTARLDAAETYRNAGEIGVIHKIIGGRSWFTLETPEHDL